MKNPNFRPSERAGCLSKLPGLQLQTLLGEAFSISDALVRNPMHRPEDCASFEVNEPIVLSSLDFGPPVGPTPQAAGRIAALHSLSDVYASGGEPRLALSILMLSEEGTKAQPRLGPELMTGMIEVCREHGIRIDGGHTVLGAETMLGLTVIGTTRRRIRKTGCTAGDCILISKPLGFGRILKAYHSGDLTNDGIANAMSWMLKSNREAATRALAVGVSAMTDVSGFGFLGHLSEMLSPGQGARIEVDSIPILPEVIGLPPLRDCRLYDGNFWYACSRSRIAGFEDNARCYALIDPQINGGILVTASRCAAAELIVDGFVQVGEVVEGESKITLVVSIGGAHVSLQ